MAVTADDLLKGLRAAGFPVIGLSLGDLAKPATWRFEGKLTDDQIAAARAYVVTALLPANLEDEETRRIEAALADPQAALLVALLAFQQRRPIEAVRAELRDVAFAQRTVKA